MKISYNFKIVYLYFINIKEIIIQFYLRLKNNTIKK